MNPNLLLKVWHYETQSDSNLSLKGLTLHLLVFTDKLNLSHQKLNLELDVILLENIEAKLI